MQEGRRNNWVEFATGRRGLFTHSAHTESLGIMAEPGRRTGQANSHGVRMLERDRTRESFPKNPNCDFIDDHSLTVRCSPDGLWPSYLSSHGVEASERVSYLQKYLIIRGCVCPEKTAEALLGMSNPHLVPSENFMKPVQLILQEDIWSSQVAFFSRTSLEEQDHGHDPRFMATSQLAFK